MMVEKMWLNEESIPKRREYCIPLCATKSVKVRTVI